MVQLAVQLESTVHAVAGPGYVSARPGDFVNESIERELTNTLTALVTCGLDDVDSAMWRFELAGHHWRMGRVDEAAALCEQNLARAPATSPANLHLLALIDAFRGDLNRASNWNARIKLHPGAAEFRLTEAQLEAERIRGLEWRSLADDQSNTTT